MLEEDPKGEQGGVHDVGPNEYADTDYEFEGTDDDMKEDRDVNEAPVEPPTDEAHHDHPTLPADPVGEDRSLEAEVVTLRQQLFAMEARAVQAEQQREKIIGETNEMDQLLAQHFRI